MARMSAVACLAVVDEASAAVNAAAFGGAGAAGMASGRRRHATCHREDRYAASAPQVAVMAGTGVHHVPGLNNRTGHDTVSVPARFIQTLVGSKAGGNSQ